MIFIFCVFPSAEKKTGLEIVPLFISVDPERDNVEQVREYVKGASWIYTVYLQIVICENWKLPA